jgi:hypothetical protein
MGIFNALGGIVGGIFGNQAAKKEARAIENAARTAAEQQRWGYEQVAGGPLGTNFAPTGASANDAIAAILGIGGDPGAQMNALDNYLESSGFNFETGRGLDAIEGQAGVRGIRNSGATARALMDYGQNRARSGLMNYLDQLGGVAGRGLQAGGMLANAATGTASNLAQITQGGGERAAGTRRGATDELFAGAGGAFNVLDERFPNPFGFGSGGGGRVKGKGKVG